MAKYKFELSVVLEGQNPDEVAEQLKSLLDKYQLEIKALALVEDKPVAQAEPVSPPVRAVERPVVPSGDEPYVTYRVADEKFRVFAKDFGLQGTELRVPKHRDFLVFRVKAFLEELGYKVEPKTNIRVVAESHVEQVPVEVGESNHSEVWQGTIFSKR